MAIPKSKDELLFQSKQNFETLMNQVQSLSAREKEEEFPPGTMNRTIRDVLAHLHHWHLMLLGWYEVDKEGRIPEMPAKGYTWKDTKLLNKRIWEKYKQHPLEEVIQMLKASHKEVQMIIERHTNEELFEKRRYKWTGSSSLSTYLRSNTSSHYHWAYKLIRKAKR